VAQVTALGRGVYRVDDDGRQRLVYVAGTEGDLWAFCDGEIYREREAAARHGATKILTAPMPATVVKVLVAPGQAVRHGDTLVLLEAMKMELPLRAPSDAVVKAVNCREGELVQPDRALVELE
jgi:biotin carboxyl carrier protein